MNISDDFRRLYEYYKKKYQHQVSFRSLKMVRNQNGVREPVFYIGVPGLMVALALTFVTIATVYVLYLPFHWYVWAPYVLLIFFMFRIALKLDKARQIRYMVYHLLEMGVKSLENAEESADPSDKQKHVGLALGWLERADKWVEEPHLKAQIELLRNS